VERGARALGYTLVLLCTAPAFAQAPAGGAPAPYPAKPVRLILGPAPGGTGDAQTRVFASSLSDLWGQQVIVDNRPGAGNTIAADIVAKAVPDGYTLLRCGIGDAIAPALYKRLNHDFMRDFAHIARIGTTPNILVVHPALPAKSVKEFIALARAHPGKLEYAAGGIGQSPHLSFELFKSMTGINVLHIPYKSTSLALTDLLAGRVAAAINNLPSQLDTVRTGKVRALGVTSQKRHPRVPEVPTIHEAGVPGFEVTSWTGMCAPAGVPRAILAKVEADTLRVLGQPALRQRLSEMGIDADPLNAEQYAALIRSETVKWAKVIKDAGISPQ
jgi:tripartite-type tricarboxylate transporter receptor subunit TctC